MPTRIEFVNERAIFERPGDRDTYVDLYAKNFPLCPNEHNSNPRVMIAIYRMDDSGEIAGFSRFFKITKEDIQQNPLFYREKKFALEGICFSGTVVQSKYRGRGIGSCLIHRVVGFAKEFMSAKYAFVTIQEDNTLSAHIFEKCGFS